MNDIMKELCFIVGVINGVSFHKMTQICKLKNIYKHFILGLILEL